MSENTFVPQRTGGMVKPPPREYRRPTSLQGAAELLAEYGEEAKILAGGQTLVPMMNFRVVAPVLIVDINKLPELDRIDVHPGGLNLGALVRLQQIETDSRIAAANPLLVEAVKHIAHYQIRNRGTWTGGCANADPSAEFPAVALICDASFGLYSTRGYRVVSAADFFLGALTTALEPDEILVDVKIPRWTRGTQWAFDEFALRTGDFALAGIAVLIDPSGEGDAVRLACCLGVGDRPGRLQSAEAILSAHGINSRTIAQAACCRPSGGRCAVRHPRRRQTIAAPWSRSCSSAPSSELQVSVHLNDRHPDTMLRERASSRRRRGVPPHLGGLPAPRSHAHGNACGLRAWSLRGMLRHRGW